MIAPIMESGFSFFFILVALGSLGILARTIFLNLKPIGLALQGRSARQPARNYSVEVMRPIDHPRVMRRLHRNHQPDNRSPVRPRAGQKSSTPPERVQRRG